jgi:hypothetical protein
MSKENKTTKVSIQEGATIPKMQNANVPFKKGASIPELQPVTPQTTNPQTGPNQDNNTQNTTTSNNDKKK